MFLTIPLRLVVVVVAVAAVVGRVEVAKVKSAVDFVSGGGMSVARDTVVDNDGGRRRGNKIVWHECWMLIH